MATLSETSRGGWRAQVCILGVRDSSTFRTKREAIAWAGSRETEIRSRANADRAIATKFGFQYGETPIKNILCNQIPIGNTPGIYVLFSDGEVTYVGKSKNMLKRMSDHADNGRNFTHYHMLPTHPDRLNEMEAHYISMLNPPENKAMREGVRFNGNLKHLSTDTKIHGGKPESHII